MILCKREISATKIIFIVALYFSSILNFSFWRYVCENIEVTNFKSAVFVVSLVFFIFIPLFMLFNLILTGKIGKWLTIILLLLSSIANYYMSVFNIYIDSDMIRNIAETNFNEASEHVSVSFWVVFLITGVVPAGLLCLVKIKTNSWQQELRTRSLAVFKGLLIAALLAAFCFKEYAVVGRNHNKITKLMNTLNYTYSTLRYYKKKSNVAKPLQILDASPSLSADANGQKNLIVLVIGETARAQNFSLGGYGKKTNPLLSKQDIAYFKQVSSCGTLTAVSLPCMFSATPKKGFDPDRAEHVENALDIAQKAGYNVLWADNDSGCKGVCQRVITKNLYKSKDKGLCKDGSCYDEILLKYLKEELPQIKDNTILVLHTMGSHGPTYYKRYPKEFEIFKPTCDTSDIQLCSQEKIVNTYDNTIAYTDYIISSAIDILKNNKDMNSSLVYVSDHGESLGENGAYLHGLPYAMAPIYQTSVPMLVWLSPQKQEQIDYGCLKHTAATDQYSHDNFYHTLLGLAGIKSTTYQAKLDILSNCKKQ